MSAPDNSQNSMSTCRQQTAADSQNGAWPRQQHTSATFSPPWTSNPVDTIVPLAILRSFVAVIIFDLWMHSKLSLGDFILDSTIYVIYLVASLTFQLSACYGFYEESEICVFIAIIMDIILIFLSIIFSLIGMQSLLASEMTFFNWSKIITIILSSIIDVGVLFTMIKKYSSFHQIQETQIPL